MGGGTQGRSLDALTREIEEKAFGDDPHVALYAMFELANQVAALGDVRAAPVLARHGGFGWRQLDLLVSFGEPGLRALLEFAPETRPDDNGLGHGRVLAALHRYLYDRGVAAVDAETLAMIRGLAERALAGPTDPMVLEWGAMGLALLVGGPELRAGGHRPGSRSRRFAGSEDRFIWRRLDGTVPRWYLVGRLRAPGRVRSRGCRRGIRPGGG